MTEFYVQLEDSSGNKLGSGPLASVQKWRYTARFDRAGTIDFDFAANDPQASIVTNRRIARAYARLNSVWVEVGAGVIDDIVTAPDNMGRVSLSASGMDLIRELSYRTVGTLEIGTGSGATHATALTAISALAPAGWTFTPAVSPDNDYIYARYGGESVLGALVHLAERTQTHFYRSTGRTLVFTSTFTSSGVRAIQSYGDLAAETCAIVSLNRTVDTHDLLTRITPYGSGNGLARLTLAATSRAAPTGYVLSAANNYIEHTASTTAYGLVNYPEIEFKDIGPISNTDADMQAAANMLFDAALEELERRSTLASQETYSLTIAGCSQLLRPLQTIRLVYRDVDQGIDINDDLYILEATWEVDASGVRTTNLVVSTDDRWPISDASAAAERAVEGKVFQAIPQLNANSYVTAYSKNVDESNIAAFRFRFGAEVVNLQQVLFEFQILPFESTVRSVASSSPTTSSGGGTSISSDSGGSVNSSSGGGGGTTASSSSGGSSTPTTAGGGGSTASSANAFTNTQFPCSAALPTVHGTFTVSGAAVDTSTVVGAPGSYSDSHIHWVTDIVDHTHNITTHTHYVEVGSHTHTVTITSHTHTVDIAAHTHSVTLADHTHAITIAAHTHTVTVAAHTHTVSPVITTVYGIFRETAPNTYALTDLDYQVNGGGWLNCEDDAVSAGSGWYQIDVTSLVQNSTTFRPLQASNLLEIRSLTLSKTATIDAQLSVRNTIQAIAYS